MDNNKQNEETSSLPDTQLLDQDFIDVNLCLEVGLSEQPSTSKSSDNSIRGFKKAKIDTNFFKLRRYPTIELGEDLSPQVVLQKNIVETSTSQSVSKECCLELPESSDSTSLMDMEISGEGILSFDAGECGEVRPVQLRNILRKRKLDLEKFTASPRSLQNKKSSSLDITLEVMLKLKRALAGARKHIPGDLQIKLLDVFTTLIERVSDLEFQVDQGQLTDVSTNQEMALEKQRTQEKHNNESSVFKAIIVSKDTQIGVLTNKNKELERLLANSQREIDLLKKQGLVHDDQFHMDCYPPPRTL